MNIAREHFVAVQSAHDAPIGCNRQSTGMHDQIVAPLEPADVRPHHGLPDIVDAANDEFPGLVLPREMVDNRLQESVQTGFYEKGDFSANENNLLSIGCRHDKLPIVYEAIPIPDCVAAEDLHHIPVGNVRQTATT